MSHSKAPRFTPNPTCPIFQCLLNHRIKRHSSFLSNLSETYHQLIGSGDRC